MPCLINSGYSLGCRDSVGGFEWLAIASYNNATIYTYGTNSVVDSFSPTASFYKFEQYTEQGLASQEGAFDNMNGTSHYTQTITFTLEQMTAAIREQFLALTQARVRVIAKTQNSKYLLFGRINGGRSSAATSGPGQAMGDLSGYTITFEFKEPEPASLVDETFALSLIV